MQNYWFEQRKELFLKELVHQFLEAKIFFKTLYREYTKKKSIPYKHMEQWIGSETKKGPLWVLKADPRPRIMEPRTLFRKPEGKVNLSEYLFDWTIGSIFHERMKLKEEVYQLEVYLPRPDAIDTSDNGDAVEKILKEYVTFTSRASQNVSSQMENIHHLFLKAAERLKELLPYHASNGLVLRFLLEHSTLVNSALGKNSAQQLLSSLFPEQPEKVFMVAGTQCLKGGWIEEAIGYFKKALERNPHNPEVLQWLHEAEKKR